MKKSRKLTAKALIIIFLFAFLLSALSACNLSEKKLVLDENIGGKALGVVNKAQYKPDIKKFIKANSASVSPVGYKRLSEEGEEEASELSAQTSPTELALSV